LDFSHFKTPKSRPYVVISIPSLRLRLLLLVTLLTLEKKIFESAVTAERDMRRRSEKNGKF